jgi:Flp pilus assembly protein TadD
MKKSIILICVLFVAAQTIYAEKNTSLAFKHPLTVNSQEREAHLQKAIDKLHSGRPLPAVAEAFEAIKANPRSAEALAVLGLAQLKCGEWEKAVSHFNKAITLDGLSPEAHLGLGIIAASRMHPRDAISHLRRSTSSQLFPGVAYSALASSLENLGLHQEASRAMREASKYQDEFTVSQLANIRALADIFAAYDSRDLYGMPEDFQSTTLHFEYSHGHIILPVVLNGSTQGDFFFDTGYGASLMLNAKYAKNLDLTYIGEMKTISVVGDLYMKAAILDSIEIGGLVMRDVPVLVCENYAFDGAGLIGWKIIQRVNTTIDFKKMQVGLFSLDNPELKGKRIVAEEGAECVTFAYLTSMYIIARFGDDIPKAFVFDTGCVRSVLHGSDLHTTAYTQDDSSIFIKIGDLTFTAPQAQVYDFSSIHEAGSYYFPGVIGIDILNHSILHILPGESKLCIER